MPLQADLAAAFHRAHEERYGFADPAREIELVAVRTADVAPAPRSSFRARPQRGVAARRVVELDGATLLGSRRAGRARRTARHVDADETMNVELQVLGARSRAVAEEMGAVLIRSAFSANIKERRDCSTALFDERGRMIVQAEHIPVHLGAHAGRRRRCHASTTRARTTSCILNDPSQAARTSPTSRSSRAQRSATRRRARTTPTSAATEPGSMPAGSRTLDEEGVVIPPTRLDDAVLDALVAQMRNPAERRGDFRAQLAAHALAERRIDRALRASRERELAAAMGAFHAYSERLVRAGIRAIPDGSYEGEDFLEARRRARIHVRFDGRGRGGDDRLLRDGRAAAGQPQLPARRDEVGVLLRRPLPRPSPTFRRAAARSRRSRCARRRARS